jgi:hypothetical protein
MDIGQLNLNGRIGSPDQPIASNTFASGAGSENSFSQLFATALELSSLQSPATSPSDNPFDAIEGAAGLLSNPDSSGLGTAFPAASFAQLLSQARQPSFLQGANSIQCSAPGAGLDVSLASPTGVTGAFDKRELSDWMDAHALTHPSHRCAMYCRMGMEAAGINTADRPLSGDAGDYGPFLLRHGAQPVSPDSYVPQAGDVVVFDKTSHHPFGHIQTYDGHHWVSDFVQQGLSPYSDANSAPPFTIYRFA